MASDTEDDDLISLREAALKTLKPKVQSIQQVVSFQGINRSQQSAPLEAYPASADYIPEFHYEPEPLPEPESDLSHDMTLPPPFIQPPLQLQNLHRLPAQSPMWTSPFTNGMSGPRNFRPQGFRMANRHPFNARGHRTFGDRGRPPFDRGGRYPRRGYMPDRGGRGFFIRPTGPASGLLGSQKPSDTDAAGGNLIVIEPKSADKSGASGKDGDSLRGKGDKTVSKQTMQEGSAKPKLSLPQDKYHSSVVDKTSTNQPEDESSTTSKPRDKFSRYNDSDSEEEEEEEDHSDTEDITNEIDNFLKDCDNEDTPVSNSAEQEKAEAKMEDSFQVEVHKLDISEDEEDTKGVECNEESKDIDSLVGSDAESVDLDALASGDPLLEDVADVEVDEAIDLVDCNLSVTKNTKQTSSNSSSAKGTPSKKPVQGNNAVDQATSSPKAVSSSSSSSSSASSSSSSSDCSDSSSENENENEGKEDKNGVSENVGAEKSTDVNEEETSSSSHVKEPSSVKSPVPSSSPAQASPKPHTHGSTSPVSPGSFSSLSPKVSKSDKISRLPTKIEQYHYSSMSPKRTLSPSHKSYSRRSFSPRPKSQSREQKRDSPKGPISPRQFSTRRSISPRRRSVSPRDRSRRRSISPRQKPLPRKRSGSPSTKRNRSNSPHRLSSLKTSRRDDSRSYRSRSPSERIGPSHPSRGNRSPIGRDSQSSSEAKKTSNRWYERDSKFSTAKSSDRERYHRDRVGNRYHRSRSHSRERYKKPLEVQAVKDGSDRKKEDRSGPGKKKIVDPPPPSIDLDKLTPEERAKIEARRKKFSSNTVTINPDKKVSLKSIKERPKKQKKSKEDKSAASSKTKEVMKIKTQKQPKTVEASSPNKDSDENPVVLEEDDSESDEDRAWKQSPAMPAARSKKSKDALINLGSVHIRKDKTGARHRCAAERLPPKKAGRSVKDRLGYSALGSQMNRADFVSDDDDDDIEENSANRLTSSIVKAKPFKANIPEEKLKIEIRVSPKRAKIQTRPKAKPDFSKVYSVPAKRHIVEEDDDEEENEEETVYVKKVKKGKKKKKRHTKESQEMVVTVAEDDDAELEDEPVQPSRPSIMDRLGKKVSLEPTVKEKKRKRKELHDEVWMKFKKKLRPVYREPKTELDVKIQKIKEKNAAIARRRREIEKDKERYG